VVMQEGSGVNLCVSEPPQVLSGPLGAGC